VAVLAHRLDIDVDGRASVSCLHGPDDPAWGGDFPKVVGFAPDGVH
jgi:hypothetical protein